MSCNWQKNYRLPIKRPNGVRRSYDIIEDIKSPGERSQVSIKKIPKYAAQADALEALNENLKNKIISENEVEIIIRDVLRPQLERLMNPGRVAQAQAVLSDANTKVFTAFWKDKYEGNRRVIDLDRVRNQYIFALRKLEPLSLHGCDQKELQKHWDRAFSGTAHRRYGRAINTLLKCIDRPERILLERNDDLPIEYITEDELAKIAAHIADPTMRDAVITMFCTGVRTGELFALTTRNLKGTTAIYVDQ